MPTSTEARNMELMQTLDDAWNGQDVEIFRVGEWNGEKLNTVVLPCSRIKRLRCRQQAGACETRLRDGESVSLSSRYWQVPVNVVVGICVCQLLGCNEKPWKEMAGGSFVSELVLCSR